MLSDDDDPHPVGIDTMPGSREARSPLFRALVLYLLGKTMWTMPETTGPSQHLVRSWSVLFPPPLLIIDQSRQICNFKYLYWIQDLTCSHLTSKWMPYSIYSNKVDTDDILPCNPDEVLGPLSAGVELNQWTARSRVSSRAISNPERVEVWAVPTEWKANKNLLVVQGSKGMKSYPVMWRL